MGAIYHWPHRKITLVDRFMSEARKAIDKVVDGLVMDGSEYDDEKHFGLEAHLIAKNTGIHPAVIEMELNAFRRQHDTSHLTSKQLTDLVKILVDTPPVQREGLKLASVSSIPLERKI